MAKLRYLQAENVDPADRDLLVRPIHLYRAMVNAPGITRAFLGLADQIRHRSRLDPRLRELAILQVAWLCRSAYEWSHHIRIGRQFGVSEGDLARISGDRVASPDPAVDAVLNAARRIAEGDGVIPEAGFAALRAHLAEDALTELLLICAVYVGVARFLRAAEIEVEEDYHAELAQFPLPDA